MTNSLRKLAKDLKAFAKRCKDFKYTEQALFVFLLCGIVGFADVTTVSTDKAIQNQRQEITTSIGDMRQQFKRLKSENDKLMKNYNLELIQLMEQGDHVVKSPWSSWQYGANTILNDWHGSYKGRGDKKEKYPYEGVLKRDSNAYNRYISKESSMYQYLPQSSDPSSASTNSRKGYGSYGLASNKIVPEPPVSFEISASIKPRIVSKGAITVPEPQALEPTLPKAIDFNPKDPEINDPVPVNIVIPVVSPGGSGNSDTQWISSNGSVATMHQIMIDGGTIDMNAKGSTFDLKVTDAKLTGRSGSGTNNFSYYTSVTSNGINTGTPTGPSTKVSFHMDNQSTWAAMKLVGGQVIDIKNATFNYHGSGETNYSERWLFHTDGHGENNTEDVVWKLDGTKINVDGNHLVVWASQYHGSFGTNNPNIGFINGGDITTTETSKGNFIWIALNVPSGGYVNNFNRVQFFENKGNVTLNGEDETFALIQNPQGTAGGFSVINDGKMELKGKKDKGVIVDQQYNHTGAEILFNNPLEISGTESVGVVLQGAATLTKGATGTTFNNSTSTLQPTSLPTNQRESILDMNLHGSQNVGLYFNHGSTFTIGDTNITSDGSKNTLMYIDNKNGNADVVVNAQNQTSKDNTLDITGGSESIGIFKKSTGTLTNGAKINMSNTKSSVGMFINGTGNVTNSGEINASGEGIKGIVAKAGNVTNTGKIIFDGKQNGIEGAVGLAAMGGNITHTGADSTITVDGSASVGAYSKAGSTLDITGGKIITTNGAFNTYAKGGTIKLNGTTVETGQKSLAFYTDDTGVINFANPVTANIAGGTDSNSRGTAFLYRGAGPGYAAFNSGTIGSWATSRFNNMSNLTLNMAPGSRLFIAQNVEMALHETYGTGLTTGLGTTPVGTDYKTFMLYLSKLNLDQNINLDVPTDPYNRLEIANSSIDNNNTNIITGTQDGQVAMAQKNDGNGIYPNPRNKVTLKNMGTISLSGNTSTGIYAKFGELKNDTTGTINMGDSSSAMYGTDDSLLENLGTINLGNNSTGLYSEGDTATGKTAANTKGSVRNDGTIASAGKAIGITYKGTGAGNTDTRVTNDTNGKINLAGEGSVGIYGLGNSYKILNNGEINLGSSSSLTSSPNVGIYTAVESVNVENSGTGKITAGNNSIGVYGYNIDNSGQITVGDNGIGIYSKKLSTGLSTVNHTGTITVGNNDATGIFLEDGGNLNFNSGAINVGDNSYGIVAIGSSPFNYNNTSTATVTLGNGSTYFYSNNPTTNITNNIALNNPSGVGIYGISSPGTIVNNANFTLGDQSVGILNTGNGIATNNATIVVGNSDTGSKNYAIGMATTTGKVVNSGSGSITIGADGIGLFADGASAQAENAGTINIAGDRGMGIYLDHGAKGVNNGTITTVGTPTGAVGVVVQHQAELTNNGTININSPDGYAMFKATGGVIKNYGTITLGSGATETFDPTSKPTSKTAGGISINAPTGATPATTTVTTIDHGTISSIVSPEHVVINNPQGPAGPSPTSLGIYIDTLGSTNPISGNLGLITDEADLIIGTEAARTTNSKNIVVSGAVLDPYIQMMAANSGVTWNAYGGSLTWIATPLYSNGQLGSVVLAKLPYTEFAGNETTPVNSSDTYNFLHGLDDRYGVDWYGDRGAREKQLFNKLNEIGKNEEALFYQATDEMMGHQYGNVQQRINETGSLLDKEFRYLHDQWRNPSKQNNKIKVFGMRNEYNTDTAGIIDYTSNAYGVAYVHEDETVKLGNSSGWYAGAVNNRFKFKDIGKSRENQTMVKAGIFKTMSPYMDHNGSLRWTIAGDVFLGKNEMKRKFLVVDDIFNAKGDYTSYGAAFKTDLGYDIRMSERTHLRPYGALKMEYGRFNSIKEDSGEIRLEVDGNDYYSIKPEVGVEFKYVQPVAVKSQLSVGLSAAYENELGKVGDVNNKARVRFTDADWFGIRGEKDDRRGNGKFDFNLGVDNTRFGVTVNAGYDTKGSNIRGGIGFRAIY